MVVVGRRSSVLTFVCGLALGVLFGLGVAYGASAQSSISLHTGFDQGASAPIGPGNPDDDWEVLTDPVGVGSVPRPATVVSPHPAWFDPTGDPTFQNSRWISLSGDQGQGIVPGQRPTYRLRFTLPPNVDLASVTLTLHLRGDDRIHQVFLNGIALPNSASPPCGTPGPGSHDPNRPALTVTATGPVPFQPGSNTLEVEVEDCAGIVTGLLVAGEVSFRVRPECPPGQQRLVIRIGEADNFDPDPDPNPASPSNGFSTWISNTLQPKPIVGLDSPQSDVLFAHSFDLSGLGPISAAWLEVRAKPLDNPLVENDTISLRVVLPNGVAVQITDPNTAPPGQMTDRWRAHFGSGGWTNNLLALPWTPANFPNGRTFFWDLSNLPLLGQNPPVTVNLIPHMNVGQSLDVLVEDDTSVDSLVLWVCACPREEPPTERWDLTIRKRAADTPWAVGSQGTITLHVENLGPGDVPASAAPVTVTDTLPAELMPLSATGTNWNCTVMGQTVQCTWAGPFPIPPGPLPPIEVTVQVQSPSPEGAVRNCAAVRAGGAAVPPEDNLHNNEDCVDIPLGRKVGPPVGIEITPKLERCLQPAGLALKMVLARNTGDQPVEIVDVRPTGAGWQEFQLMRGRGTIRPGGVAVILARGRCTGEDLAVELELADGTVIPAAVAPPTAPSASGPVRLMRQRGLLVVHSFLPSGEVQALQLELFDLAGRRILSARSFGPRLLMLLESPLGEASPANGVYLARITIQKTDGSTAPVLRKLVLLR